MNFGTFTTTYQPKVKWLLIAGLLSILIIVHTWLTQPLSGNLPDVLESKENKTRKKELKNATPCAPVGQYDQFNTCLIKYVRKYMLLPPSGLPYIPFNGTTVDGVRVTDGVAEKVDFMKKHFLDENSPPGFFIECGANDGTFLSPTLRLEREFNWTGVLIEANPSPFKQLVALHRNAWMMNAALCTKPNSEVITFYAHQISGISGVKRREGLPAKLAAKTIIEVPCIPLYTVLAAMGITTVDFFSLDVEGVELDILKTVPFDKIIFKVLIAEHGMSPGFQPGMIDFLESRGYKFIGSILSSATQDSLFVHESVYTPEMSTKIKYHRKA